MVKVGEILQQIEVIFCGKSLYLMMLASGLQQDEKFRVCKIDNAPDKAIPEIKMFYPDVVMLEAGNEVSNIVDALRKAHAQLVLVIVYPESDSVEIVYDEQRFIASIDQLAQSIKAAVGKKRMQ